jgi:hypothetical protein
MDPLLAAASQGAQGSRRKPRCKRNSHRFSRTVDSRPACRAMPRAMAFLWIPQRNPRPDQMFRRQRVPYVRPEQEAANRAAIVRNGGGDCSETAAIVVPIMSTDIQPVRRGNGLGMVAEMEPGLFGSDRGRRSIVRRLRESTYLVGAQGRNRTTDTAIFSHIVSQQFQ